jgi:geranylgeranyl pyrophosphate synthase
LYKAYHDSIQEKIEAIWASADVWPPLLAGMRQAVQPLSQYKADDIRPRVWAPLLPGLCCQAAGGELEWSITVSAAWSLFHVAAHLLDSVADQDEPDPRRAAWGSGVTINVATGLIISASWALNLLLQESTASEAASDLIAGFHNHLFTVSSGQQVDLLEKQPTTGQWWHVAEAKAGAPFALASWAGARLSSRDSVRLEEFRSFGHHLGLLVQVLDDARDFFPEVYNAGKKEIRPVPRWSLPIAYAMEVLPSAQQRELRQRLASVTEDPAESERVIEIVEISGASLYIETYLDFHREKAMNSIINAALDGPAKERLIRIIELLLEPE